MDTSNNNQIYNLLVKLIDNDLCDQEHEYLRQWSRNNPDAVEIYSKFMQDYALMQRQIGGQVEVEYGSSEDTKFDYAILEALKEVENNAAEVIIEKPKDLNEIKNDTLKETLPKKPNKFFRIFDKFVYLAAVLMIIFIVYAEIFSPQYSVPVATVMDQIGVEWDKNSEKLNNGERILTNQPLYKITKGVIELSYDQGVDLVIEGPAEFQVERLGLYLGYGRLYTKVSKIGQGFTVDSPSSRFIDLGTEFGVQVENDGSSELHVLDGKVQYYSGVKGDEKQSKLVTEDNALRYNAQNGTLEDIPLRENTFAREIKKDINSNVSFVWRGQNKLDLADMVCRGNGYGTGNVNYLLDPLTGNYARYKTVSEDEINNQDSHILYYDGGDSRHELKPERPGNLVESNPFVDMVFIPSQMFGPLVISSEQHIFDNCPETAGTFYHYITSGIQNDWANEMIKDPDQSILHLSEEPCIYLHSNLGITFDLDKIRQILTNQRIAGFESLCASEYLPEKNIEVKAEFIVLVDGKVKFWSPKMVQGESEEIGFSIKDTDRFLTLISVDGGDDSYYDRTYYVRPELVLEEK